MEAYVLDNEPNLIPRLANFVANEPITFRTRAQIHTQPQFRPRPLNVPSFTALSEQQKQLPVYAKREEILATILQNTVTIIGGETGSGKTTQIPQYILNDYAMHRENATILCTQPRRLAVCSMAKRVAEERKTELGNEVGYQIKCDAQICQNTSLIFMTRIFAECTKWESKCTRRCHAHHHR